MKVSYMMLFIVGAILFGTQGVQKLWASDVDEVSLADFQPFVDEIVQQNIADAEHIAKLDDGVASSKEVGEVKKATVKIAVETWREFLPKFFPENISKQLLAASDLVEKTTGHTPEYWLEQAVKFGVEFVEQQTGKKLSELQQMVFEKAKDAVLSSAKSAAVYLAWQALKAAAFLVVV